MNFDLIIRNGKIIDGTGAPWFRADVGVRDGKIAALGSLKNAAAKETVDAARLYVAPGFVDIHSHGDFTLTKSPDATVKLLQGVTTQLDGNCGMSVAPLAGEGVKWAEKALGAYGVTVTWRTFPEFRGIVEKQGTGVNFANLVGHGTVRLAVMGYDQRRPTPAEMERMKVLVREAMESGCIGMSTGLVYPPGFNADIDEIVELCRVVAEYGGIYTSHVRGDRETQIEAARELVETAERAGIPTIFSHIEAKYPKNAPAFQRWKLSMLEEARTRGADITADTHEVTWTGVPDVRWILPFPWRVMGGAEFAEALKDPETRRKVIDDFHLDPGDPRAKGGPFGLTQSRAWHRVRVYRSAASPDTEGRTIREIADRLGVEPEDAVLDLFVREGGTGPFLLLRYIESDLSVISSHPLVVPVMSDVFASEPEDIPGGGFELIPEWLGIFPEFLRTFVLDRRYVTLEEGVRKITSLPLRMMRIWDRGLVRPGFWADLVVFDDERIGGGSSLENPRKHPEGISRVIVNGVVACEDGRFTGRRAGRILKRAEPA